MKEKLLKAERINTQQWYVHTRTWHDGDYIDAVGEISPRVAAAKSAHPWEITVRLGKTALKPGDHIAIEFNVTWTPDRGRPFLYGRRTFQEEWNPGYGATPIFEMPNGVEYDFAVSDNERMNRYFIIDAVITSEMINPGKVLKYGRQIPRVLL
jgi:hypothetical protein